MDYRLHGDGVPTWLWGQEKMRTSVRKVSRKSRARRARNVLSSRRSGRRVSHRRKRVASSKHRPRRHRYRSRRSYVKKSLVRRRNKYRKIGNFNRSRVTSARRNLTVKANCEVPGSYKVSSLEKQICALSWKNFETRRIFYHENPFNSQLSASSSIDPAIPLCFPIGGLFGQDPELWQFDAQLPLAKSFFSGFPDGYDWYQSANPSGRLFHGVPGAGQQGGTTRKYLNKSSKVNMKFYCNPFVSGGVDIYLVMRRYIVQDTTNRENNWHNWFPTSENGTSFFNTVGEVAWERQDERPVNSKDFRVISKKSFSWKRQQKFMSAQDITTSLAPQVTTSTEIADRTTAPIQALRTYYNYETGCVVKNVEFDLNPNHMFNVKDGEVILTNANEQWYDNTGDKVLPVFIMVPRSEPICTTDTTPAFAGKALIPRVVVSTHHLWSFDGSAVLN